MKRFTSLFLVAIMLVMSLSATAFAAETKEASLEAPQPRLYKEVTADLNHTDWTVVVSDDNWLNEYIIVTSDTDNPGLLYVRVVNSKGVVVGKEKTVLPGDFIALGPVPHNSGEFTVEAKTANKTSNGSYHLTIEDR